MKDVLGELKQRGALDVPDRVGLDVALLGLQEHLLFLEGLTQRCDHARVVRVKALGLEHKKIYGC